MVRVEDQTVAEALFPHAIFLREIEFKQFVGSILSHVREAIALEDVEELIFHGFTSQVAQPGAGSFEP